MAQTIQDTTLLSDTTGQEVIEQVVESRKGEAEAVGIKQADERSSSSPSVAVVTDPHVEKTSQNSTTARPNASSSHPSLVTQGSNHVQTSSITPVAPHPKRFSAVNINKKFLEKNTVSGSGVSSSSSSTTKSGNAATRPSVQPSSSHSRLVTTKLTASLAVASSTAGWSRPSSVAPSPATATNSPSSTSPLPTTPAIQPSAVGAPQLPHSGKVMIPQARIVMGQTTSSQKDPTGAKAVWGNVKPPFTAPTRLDIEPSDFPTAAEVANVASSGRKHAKALEEAKTQSENISKQLRAEEADAFRGVHLAPNHHWDEMEGDDDDFLGGVIEFGDGRQYKIESSESPAGSLSKHQDDSVVTTAGPVSKEERFVDDFDRSWPKSRNSPSTASRDSLPPATHGGSPNVSPAVSHSPVDSSRVLFNERSNRLEPYNQTQRSAQGTFGAKRTSHHEGGETKILQKPLTTFNSRNRRFSASNNGMNTGPPNGFMGDRNREQDQLPNRRDMPPPSPRRTGRDFPSVPNSGLDADRGRKMNMGPPPVPAHAAQKYPQDGGRQPPPHLSQVSPNVPTRRLPSRDSRFSPSESSAGLPSLHSGLIPPHSPAISHSSLSLVSPISGPNSTLPVNSPELDEVRKDVMHTAAERAKQRRLQEEQEREAQKERARQKAAEIEAKMKAQEAEKTEKERGNQQEADEAAEALEKEKEAISLIEEAVKSADTSIRKPERPPPLKPVLPASDAPRSAVSRRPGATNIISPKIAPLPSPAAQADSWRARANPPPLAPTATPTAVPVPRHIQARPPASAIFISSGPSAVERVQTIADNAKEELEVVDFSEMGKFVGVSESPEAPPGEQADVKSSLSVVAPRQRPVASDFFDTPTVTNDSSVPSAKKADFGAWRRKVSQDLNELPKPLESRSPAIVTTIPQEISTTETTASKQQTVVENSTPLDTSLISSRETLTHQDQAGQTVCLPSSSEIQRTPRIQTFYKDPAMSALDDAMSRIKGVLSGMHTQDTAKGVVALSELEASQKMASQPPQSSIRSATVKERWVPPARRPRKTDDSDEPREVFLFTMQQLPTLLASSDSPVVRIPSGSKPVELIPRKQLQAFHRHPYQARMDILSFDPPVYDMNRRDLSINDVLFRKPNIGFKSKFKYRVVIPRSIYRGPKVNIPSSTHGKPNGSGAFGRPTAADGAPTWRKTAPPTTKADTVNSVGELDTTSRSPPPSNSPPEAAVASMPKSQESSPSKSDSNPAARSRTYQLKMPDGSAVAFIRDSRIDVVEADQKPLVNFIVGSQLEDSPNPEPATIFLQNGSTDVSLADGSERIINGVSKPPLALATSTERQTSSFTSTKAGSSDSSSDPILVTPPTHHASATWTRSSANLTIKESPARAPDPEHLRAVWSQTSDKAGLHPVNSLEGIGDDLTALPFTLQDVKSEDGETPPPTLPSAPSRMSLHEVTRAFQTVPTSSSSPNQAPHRAAFSPPSTNAPVARPTTLGYSYSPAPQNNMRPYVPYATPMMSHSPAPVMYGHPITSSPVPTRMPMNSQTPLYSQHMWMSMPNPSQSHGNMIRPMSSPYPAQIMPYPPASYPQPPPPNMMASNPQQGQQNGAPRGRGMGVMSPVMSHAHAIPGQNMYGSSPVMLHAVQIPPQNHGYMPVATGRGQPLPRAENGQIPSSQQPHSLNGHHPQTHNGFNPTSSFLRPAW